MLKMVLGVFAVVVGMATANVSFAYDITVNAQILQNGSAGVQACNYQYNFPLVCSVLVRGIYPNGTWMQAWQTQNLYPGQCEWAYVSPGYGGVFVDAQSDFNCQTM